MRPDSSFNATAGTVQSHLQHSPWHSPVPYLFGGLAAMLGLIAFALLILACSYWKFSGQSEGDENGERVLENSDKKPVDSIKDFPDFEEKIVVIMAGDYKPTFLAKPICSRASSFTDQSQKNQNQSQDKNQDQEEKTQNQETQNQESQSEETQNRNDQNQAEITARSCFLGEEES